MSLPDEQPLNKLQFYVSNGYSCGYLPNKMAQSLIASPQHLVNSPVYSQLIRQGFRRSGQYAYRPHCENCQSCIPVRVVLDAFTHSRNQKRILKKYQHLKIRTLPLGFHEEHFALYQQYQRTRHAPPVNSKDQEDHDSVESYQNFLCVSEVESVLIEFRENETLKMVSIVDIVQDGISAVYTFYDTQNKKDSFGIYNVLWQANWGQQLSKPYLYLGYWIADCHKMNYKKRFQPQESFTNGSWQASP